MTNTTRPAALAAAIEALLAERGQPDEPIRALRTAAPRITRATGRSANDIPLAPLALRPLLLAVRPAAIGVTRKAWTNSLAALRQLGALTGWAHGEPDLAGDLGEAWAGLVAQLPISPKRSVRRRLGAWAAAKGISPEALNEYHLAEYERHLTEHDYTISPRGKAGAARIAWNLGSRTVPGWPANRLAAPVNPRMRILPPSAFPENFIANLAHYHVEATGRAIQGHLDLHRPHLRGGHEAHGSSPAPMATACMPAWSPTASRISCATGSASRSRSACCGASSRRS